jgi:predicted DNA-binding transcriptional regulator YafY
MILIKKDKVTAKELSEYFEVSVRTIQRDIETLNLAKIPIYSEMGKNGGYKLVDNYKFDKNFLNVDEGKVLVSFLKSLEDAIPTKDVKSIFNKFSSFIPEKGNDNFVFKLKPFTDNKNINTNLNIIIKAMEENKKLNLHYVDINFKNTKRTVCPYKVVIWGSTWYVYAFCILRKDYRMFKLSRILSCDILNETFEHIIEEETLPWEDNYSSYRESIKIILELDKCMLGKIPDYFDYNNCKIEKESIIVEVNFPIDEWLFSLILSLVPHVKILEPESFRNEFLNRLNTAIDKNKS